MRWSFKGICHDFLLEPSERNFDATLVALWPKHSRNIFAALVPFMRNLKKTRRKTKAMTLAPCGTLRSRLICRHSLYNFLASPYLARPWSLRASSNKQFAVNTSSPVLARSFCSRSWRTSRTESASVVACCTLPSSMLPKGGKCELSSAGEFRARPGGHRDFSHLPADHSLES